VRGYGFVGADDNGEDVFLHASVYSGDTDELVPGTRIEFDVMAGDRGRKAFAAHLLDDDPAGYRVPVPRPFPAPSSSLVPPQRAAGGAVPPPRTGEQSAAPAADAGHAPDDEQLCDVLSTAEFGQELTELLLSSTPSLTGQQVLGVRERVLEFAQKRGWVDM
jgi:cold shock CspA family protein